MHIMNNSRLSRMKTYEKETAAVNRMSTLTKEPKEEEERQLSDEALDEVVGGMPQLPVPDSHQIPNPFHPDETNMTFTPPDMLLPPQ